MRAQRAPERIKLYVASEDDSIAVVPRTPGEEYEAAYIRADRFDDLLAALREMLDPPLILASDDATEVAAWYDSRARAAIDAATREE